MFIHDDFSIFFQPTQDMSAFGDVEGARVDLDVDSAASGAGVGRDGGGGDDSGSTRDCHWSLER